MSINDHLALTEKRRREIEDVVSALEMFRLQSPGVPVPNVDGAMLVDAVSHIQVLDNRLRVFANIFRAIQDLGDRLAGASEEDLVSAHEVSLVLAATIQTAITPQSGGATE